MQSDGVPQHDEAARLAAVRRYDILDTPPDGAFDRITALAARLCDVPIATITVVDEDRIWFKSAYGIEVDQIDREPGLCASAILEATETVVTDAAIDPRTLDNSLVRGELGLRFYVSVPLRTADGFGLGTLNIIDVEPRELRPGELENLHDLAAIVMDELELRLAARRAIADESHRDAARYRDTLLAGFSHEMRTPIAIMQGVLSTVGSREADDAETPRLLALMGRQIRHLDWLVGQFLDFALFESSHHEPQADLEPQDLGPVVEEAASLFRDRVEILVDVAHDAPQACADRARTGRIVTELLNNAVRFGGTQHPIRVTVAPGETSDTVAVTVADQGPGITDADRPRVFERYTRAPGSTGSGVGLFVSQAAARVQGGKIEVTSSPGSGSRFTLTLPAA